MDPASQESSVPAACMVKHQANLCRRYIVQDELHRSMNSFVTGKARASCLHLHPARMCILEDRHKTLRTETLESMRQSHQAALSLFDAREA